ncbi:MAG TPA: riboflavin kinase [Acidimicrobiales bacterium]|jgi:riboflavin kinase/FMN adenylyltransferase|nr:riboflavin kinase [Acidimicrobiales bacterium]
MAGHGAAAGSSTSTARIHRIVLEGIVEHGDKRGRTIGFPTANVRLGLQHAHVPDGVYAATARLEDGSVVNAAVSIGRRPTFYAEGERLCEAHLIDFDGDLYDTVLAVRPIWFVRGQHRFDSIEQLVAQLRDDVEQCRTLLAHTDAIAR